MSKNKLNICVDFDGVLNNYTGWKGEEELFTPKKHSKEFLQRLNDEYNIIIFTSRDTDNVKEWMDLYQMPYNSITNIKEGAYAYIDDRALKFNGNYNECLENLKEFKAYWENNPQCDEDFNVEVVENRFKKLDFGGGYVIRDSQVNGLPQIRLQFSDEAFMLCQFLNKIVSENYELKKENKRLKTLRCD